MTDKAYFEDSANWQHITIETFAFSLVAQVTPENKLKGECKIYADFTRDGAEIVKQIDIDLYAGMQMLALALHFDGYIEAISGSRYLELEEIAKAAGIRELIP